MKVKREKGEDRWMRGRRIRERMIRIIERLMRAIQTKMCRESRLAKTIPARKASENHTKGSRVVSCSCIRLGGEVFATCIVIFHHSIELNGQDKIQSHKPNH